MKVLRIIASMDPCHGGPCQGIRNSIPPLEKLGVHNEVLSLDSPNASFLKKDQFTTHAIGPAKNAWKYTANLMPWLFENLPRYDVVIVHGIWLYPSHAALKAVRELRRKAAESGGKSSVKVPRMYVMPHGMLDPYFQQAESRRFKAIRNWAYYKLIEKHVIETSDGLLFTCEEELRLARLTFRPYRPKNEINIGYGVTDPPPFSQEMLDAFLKKCPEVEGRSFLLFLGRIHPKKGVDLLIEAYAKLSDGQLKNLKNDAGPRSSSAFPALVIAGPGLDTDYGRALQEKISKSPWLKRSIFFAGMLGGDAKWGAFYCCEAFALPSHQENFGISVVEALGCGKPVLISNQVNIWRDIEQEKAGLIANDTLEGTLELLSSWFQAEKEEQSMFGTNARKCFEFHFSIKPAAERFLQVLQANFMTQIAQI